MVWWCAAGAASRYTVSCLHLAGGVGTLLRFFWARPPTGQTIGRAPCLSSGGSGLVCISATSSGTNGCLQLPGELPRWKQSSLRHAHPAGQTSSHGGLCVSPSGDVLICRSAASRCATDCCICWAGCCTWNNRSRHTHPAIRPAVVSGCL